MRTHYLSLCLFLPTKNGSHPKHNPTYYSEKQREKSPKATENATAINAQGEAVLKGILTNPNVVKTVRHHARFGEVLEYRIPGGQGARFTSDGKTFIGFF